VYLDFFFEGVSGSVFQKKIYEMRTYSAYHRLIWVAYKIWIQRLQLINEYRNTKRIYKQREELNISYQTGASLGPIPDNEINTVEFFKSTKLLKVL